MSDVKTRNEPIKRVEDLVKNTKLNLFLMAVISEFFLARHAGPIARHLNGFIISERAITFFFLIGIQFLTIQILERF